MNIQITHFILHEPAQVRALLREAKAIASELEDEDLTYERAFDQACQLLGQRWTFAAPTSPVQLPTMAIPGNHGRH